jgi:hypothetical protein
VDGVGLPRIGSAVDIVTLSSGAIRQSLVKEH